MHQARGWEHIPGLTSNSDWGEPRDKLSECSPEYNLSVSNKKARKLHVDCKKINVHKNLKNSQTPA